MSRLSLPSRSRRRRAPFAVAGAAVVAALAAGLVARARRGRGASAASQTPERPPTVPGPPSQEPAAEAVERTWSCECGQEYRVRGEDRHRVYWLPDAAIADPLLTMECVACERPLPREHEPAAPPAD